MNKVKVPVKVLPNGEGLELPFYATSGSAGMDLLSAIDNDIVLKSGGRVLVPTGLQFGLPQGYEVQIRPRSGLAIKNGITLVNSPGTIDSDYRGEVGIIMINHGEEDFVITRGMRIAQAVLCPVWQICWDKVEELDETYRGSSGFGSTGLNNN